jgi:hypothetical protein
MTTDDTRSEDAMVTVDVGADQSPSEAVVQALADATGAAIAPVERAGSGSTDDRPLPPLYDAIDPEALDALFQPPASGLGPTECEVTFSHDGYEVTVTGGDRVTVARHRTGSGNRTA